MTNHQAKFGDTTCQVQIEPRPTINGGPIFIGKVFQLESDRSALRQILNDENLQVEISEDSELLALAAAVEFFESRFGAMDGEWSHPSLTRKMIAILPPRQPQ